MGPGIWKLARNEKMKFEKINLEGFSYLRLPQQWWSKWQKNLNAILTSIYLYLCIYVYTYLSLSFWEVHRSTLYLSQEMKLISRAPSSQCRK